MKRHGEVLDVFFNGGDVARMRNYSDMANQVATSVKNAKATEARLRRDLGGKVTRWAPEELVRNVLSRSLDSVETAKVMSIASRIPGAKDSLRNGVMNEIQQKLYPTGNAGSIDFNALNRLLRDYEGNITQVMGPEYVQSLRRIATAGPMLMRDAATGSNIPVQSLLQKGFQQFEGPFSSGGRFLTFLKMARGQNVPYLVYEALTDPKKLEQLANRTRIATHRQRKLSSGAVAGYELASEENYVRD